MNMNSIDNQQSTINNPIIYPIILSVPEKDRQLSGRKKVASLSRYARQALEISARKSGIVLPELLKNENGAPLPFNGTYWSLTHKIRYVGAVVASARTGIDIEEIRPCSEALFKKTAAKTEWDLADNTSFALFFRFWTSKECVLKAVGTGIKDLSKCRIVEIIDDNNLLIDYQGQQWRIEHSFFDGHIASDVKNEFDIQWTIIT